ncbi:hypothetical protein GCM10007868_30480 [Gluconobacter frateurii]|uniref:HTH cro/C1-type domain-containing protein n=2 Tax=Gluconobacter frateurii TaxID=38308 RepID=A0ABQ0Q8X2_9PROT|nr:hypothetical protein AA0228_0664 [Gluconobacter frateurii NRIC 0228]GLP91973.1 hypothetical protein GCM10007868_30480 [Gluconobacter frateurii]
MNHRLKDPATENRNQAFRFKLGAIIRRERTNARLSRRVLCERVGLAETSLCRIEDGTMTPNIVLVMDLLWEIDAPQSACLELFQADAELRRAAA